MSLDHIQYQRLAIAVMHLAVSDFHNRALPSGQRVETGRFLLERDDELAVLWFTAAGLDMSAVRKARQDWWKMLHGLRHEDAFNRRRGLRGYVSRKGRTRYDAIAAAALATTEDLA